MFAFYTVLSYKILIQTRRSSTLHLIAHVEAKFVPNVLFDTVNSLCTLKTSIIDFGKEKEHCSRYKCQNVWFLLKSPHMPSFPLWPIAFIIEQTIDYKSCTNPPFILSSKKMTYFLP
jgi:hypothetical protein